MIGLRFDGRSTNVTVTQRISGRYITLAAITLTYYSDNMGSRLSTLPN